MARCMARRIRSGVLVGPGTKRKLRPAIPTSRKKKEGGGARAARPPPIPLPSRSHRPASLCATHLYYFVLFFTSLGVALPNTPTSAETARLLAELSRVATAAVDPAPALLRRLEAAGRPSRAPRVL